MSCLGTDGWLVVLQVETDVDQSAQANLRSWYLRVNLPDRIDRSVAEGSRGSVPRVSPSVGCERYGDGVPETLRSDYPHLRHQRPFVPRVGGLERDFAESHWATMVLSLFVPVASKAAKWRMDAYTGCWSKHCPRP